MGRKGKSQKHTAKEINAKHQAAKNARGAAGGGGAGAAARKNAAAKILMSCTICKTNQPSVKSMMIHYESKHPKICFESVREGYEKISGSTRDAINSKKKAKTHMIGAVKAQASSKTKNKELSARAKKALAEKQMAFLESTQKKKDKRERSKKKK